MKKSINRRALWATICASSSWPAPANAKIGRASKLRLLAISPVPTKSGAWQAGPARGEDQPKTFALGRIVGAARVIMPGVRKMRC
jgi:hypothetical protein